MPDPAAILAQTPRLGIGPVTGRELGTPRPPLKSAIPIASVFHEPWWLDAASDGTYEEVSVLDNGIVIARMPYLRMRKFGGQAALVMPALTHVLGPAIAPKLDCSPIKQASREIWLYKQLIAQLPRSAHVWFAMNRQVTNTLPFEEAGYVLSVDFTSELAPGERDVIWRRMRDKTRNVIRRAEESLTVNEIKDPDFFFDFYEENLHAKGRINKFPRRLYRNVMEACIQRQRGRILAAVDSAGALQAAIFTAWDAEIEHYLLSTHASQSGNGATSLLLWSAIQAASEQHRIFDFDGIKHETNRLLLAGFGGVTKPRFLVSKSSTFYNLGHFVTKNFKEKFRRY